MKEHNNMNTINVNEQEKVLSVTDWLKILVIFAIPFVNVVMWIVWLVSKKTNLNLKNFLIASLIMTAIFMLLVFIFAFGFFGFIAISKGY